MRSANNNFAGRLILVVDDESFVREVLTEILREEGYRVVEASTAERALQIADSEPISAFLLDVEMPGTTGIELCRRLRKLPQHHSTPIIFVTGLETFDGLSGAFAAGCDDFIRKPVNSVELRVRLEGHLTKMDYFQQLERTRRMLNQYLSRRTAEVVESVS